MTRKYVAEWGTLGGESMDLMVDLPGIDQTKEISQEIRQPRQQFLVPNIAILSFTSSNRCSLRKLQNRSMIPLDREYLPPVPTKDGVYDIGQHFDVGPNRPDKQTIYESASPTPSLIKKPLLHSSFPLTLRIAPRSALFGLLPTFASGFCQLAPQI